MWEQLIQFDKDLLVYLNGLGNETWDPFWLYITHQINWWPLFLIVLFLLYKKLSIKQLTVPQKKYMELITMLEFGY